MKGRLVKNLPAVSLLALIRGYQVAIAPMIGPRCRFAPSCSHYTAEAIAVHGVRAGLLLGARRILKCHPWGASGFDPVPATYQSITYKTELK
ncbi:MAG: membrane protein insertion efficiency factor YidD [Rhodospirillaceae bacterium]|nr:membrane protein insertion efficiency factor YidD [Rhodospirillaceae bacterium]